MGIKSMFGKRPSGIDIAVAQAREERDSYLVDVRNPAEYEEGHIKGSINLPLAKIEDIDEITDSLESKIYLYCQSGRRSSQAAGNLHSLGYENAVSIGGITDWSGEIERGGK